MAEVHCKRCGSVAFVKNGTRYYDIHQQVVPASQDRCGKRLADCHRRFWPPTGGGLTDVNSPANALPIRSFPGLARTRV